MPPMRLLKKLVFLFVLVVAGWWLLSKADVVPSIGDLFKQQHVTIEETATLVTEIKALAQLVTVSAYDELVADSTRSLLPRAFQVPMVFPPVVLPRNMVGNRILVLVGKTTTHVGLNLERLKPEHINTVGDSIHILLPRAQVLDVVLNPSGVDVFIEEGAWSQQAIATLKNQMRQEATRKAVAKGLLQQAEAKATRLFTQLLTAAGYKKVTIAFG